MGKWVHRLSNVNIDTRTADCAACGPNVRIKIYRRDGLVIGRKCRSKQRCHEEDRKRGYNRRGVTTVDVSWDEMQAALRAQNGHCRICDVEVELVPDHDHVTRVFRGWLCNRCNLGLGYFLDDPKRLEAAADYMRKAPTPEG